MLAMVRCVSLPVETNSAEPPEIESARLFQKLGVVVPVPSGGSTS